MIVQWCIKGMSLDRDEDAKSIMDSREGLVCNWWRDQGIIDRAQVRDQLTLRNLDLHVNHYGAQRPDTGRPVRETTPFISLSAGVIERDVVARTNRAHRAMRTALWFGTEFGSKPDAYLFRCWVVLPPRQAVDIEGVAEEVRDLNTYRRYSDFQTEGEILAKVAIPDNQIQSCEKWSRGGVVPGLAGTAYTRAWTHANPRFTPPDRLSNIRGVI